MHRPRGDMRGHRGGHHGPGPGGPFGRGHMPHRPAPPPPGGFGRNYGPPPPTFGSGYFGGWRRRHNGCLGGCLLPLLALGGLFAIVLALIF